MDIVGLATTMLASRSCLSSLLPLLPACLSLLFLLLLWLLCGGGGSGLETLPGLVVILGSSWLFQFGAWRARPGPHDHGWVSPACEGSNQYMAAGDGMRVEGSDSRRRRKQRPGQAEPGGKTGFGSGLCRAGQTQYLQPRRGQHSPQGQGFN